MNKPTARTRPLTVHVLDDVYVRLKVFAAQHGIKMYEFVSEAITEKLEAAEKRKRKAS